MLKFLFKEKYQNFNIWWYFKVPQLIVFGQILANFDGFWQFWADFSGLAMIESMPKLQLKSLKPHNF
jgi:hypothetical protein